MIETDRDAVQRDRLFHRRDRNRQQARLRRHAHDHQIGSNGVAGQAKRERRRIDLLHALRADLFGKMRDQHFALRNSVAIELKRHRRNHRFIGNGTAFRRQRRC